MEIRYYGDKLSERIAKTPEGFLICQDVPISRTGYQEYLAKELMDDPINGDKIIPVYRPAKEVFDIRSLASFEGKPVTNEHPDEDVTPENYQQYSCGHVQNVHVGDGEDSNKVLADLYITDPTLIRLIENGKREVSCGYYAEEEKDSSGRLYQTKIRGNHVAVVRSGRAGNKVCIRDSNPLRNDSHIETLSDYIEGLRYIKDEGRTGIQALRHKNKNRGDSDYSNYLTEDDAMEENEFLYDDDEILEDDDELMYDDDEILEDDDEMILEDDDELMYDDDEILEDDDELLIRDEGKKGMKKGQHVMARDPDYLAALKGGAVGAGAAGAAVGLHKGAKHIMNANLNPNKKARSAGLTYNPKTRTGRALNFASGVKNKLGKTKVGAAVRTGAHVAKKGAAGAALAGLNQIGKSERATKAFANAYNFVSKHPTGIKRAALGAGIAAAGGLGAMIGSRRNRGDSWYHDDDELLINDDELMLDDDLILEDDDEILEDGCHEDGCRYEDEDEILEDDDEAILEDDDEMILEDDDDVIESAKSIISDARYTLNKIKRNLRRANRRYDSEIITEDDDEILEDDDEILEDDDEMILEDDDEAILEDDDEAILEDDDEMILEDDDEAILEDDDEAILEDDDEAILEDDDEAILEDDDEAILEDDEEAILEDDDEAILEDDDEMIFEDDDEDILQDDDEILEDDDELMYDDDEILEDDDEILEDDDEVIEDDDEVIEDENPESEVIDTDKSAALREITEASRGITDPNERKQIQDAIYSALCGKKNQMADVMRITKKARKAKMDAAFDSTSKVSLDKQQSIYDSFNPHKKTSF